MVFGSGGFEPLKRKRMVSSLGVQGLGCGAVGFGSSEGLSVSVAGH